MKTAIKLAAPALLLGLLNMSNANAAGFQDTARVVSSTPVYENVNDPKHECWDEKVGYETVGRDRTYGGTVLGTIVGGILGNQIGRGGGRTVATAVGAATGAVIGNNTDRDARDPGGYERPVYEQRCRTVDNWSQRLTGYNVTYRYQGHEYNTFMPYDPGRSVTVNVNVSLAERY